MTASARRPRGPTAAAPDPGPSGRGRVRWSITGAIAACAAAGTGLAVLTLLVLIGWIAAPHAGLGLTGVLRTAALCGSSATTWVSRCPAPAGSACCRSAWCCCPARCSGVAGRWVVRPGEVSRLRHVGYAALALAVPYALLAGALALASQSALATPRSPQAVVCRFLLALVAGGLGGARALAPWRRLVGLLPTGLAR